MALAGGLGLSACSGNSGQGLAQQACVHVHRSVVAYEKSRQVGVGASEATALKQKADTELGIALRLAAQATSADGTWNSLMTVISESNTIDEGHLIPSLDAQCAMANANQNINPQGPGRSTNPAGTTPNTANVNPQSSGS